MISSLRGSVLSATGTTVVLPPPGTVGGVEPAERPRPEQVPQLVVVLGHRVTPISSKATRRARTA